MFGVLATFLFRARSCSLDDLPDPSCYLHQRSQILKLPPVLLDDDVHAVAPKMKRGKWLDSLYDRCSEEDRFACVLKALEWDAQESLKALPAPLRRRGHVGGRPRRQKRHTSSTVVPSSDWRTMKD